MALNIKNPEADRLAHELARVTGESLTDAVIVALRNRLAAVRSRRERSALHADIARIQAYVASLPVRDDRAPEEILGYDAYGLPS